MLRIKRTKQGPPTVQAQDGRRVEIPGPVAVHYATAVSQRGSIGGWSRSQADAVAVTDGAAQRVKAFHAGKKNVGLLEFEPVDVTAAQLAGAVAAEDAVGAAEFAKLQEECKRLAAANASLEKQADESRQEAAKARSAALEAAEQIERLNDELADKRDEAAKLAARAMELEAQLAQAPANSQSGGKKK